MRYPTSWIILGYESPEEEYPDWRMSVETDADGVTESVIVEETQENARLVGCNNARSTGMLH